MEDITPKLLDGIQADFKRRFDKSQKIADLYKRVRDGTATYKQAQEFAVETGEILASVFGENIYSEILPDGKLYYNIANRIIPKMLENNYNLTSEVVMNVQENLNKMNGIGLKAVKPELNQDKIDGIVNIVSGKEKFDDIAYMLNDPIVNFTQCVIDDAVRANADFHSKSGLSEKIIRTSSGKCCEWCDKLAGVYEYDEVSNTGNPVFQRHKNCSCLVELYADGKAQNVHSKQWVNAEDAKRRIENSLEKSTGEGKRTSGQAEIFEKMLKMKYTKK